MTPWWRISPADVLITSVWLTVLFWVEGFPQGAVEWVLLVAPAAAAWVTVRFALHWWRTR